MLPIAEQPVKLEPAIIARALSGLPQTECPVIHRFADGLYIREMSIPADTFIVGCDHISGGINICLKGSGVLFVDGAAKHVEAPAIINAGPGSKMMHTLTDVVWWNIFPNEDNEHDIQTLEGRIVRKDDSFKALEKEALRLESDSKLSDVASYSGVSDEIVTTLNALAYKHDANISVEIRQSPIDGQGVFCPYGADAGHVFGVFSADGACSQLGRYINHAKSPNCQVVAENGALLLIAVKPVHGKLGGMHGEELTIDYRTLDGLLEVAK